MTTDKNKKGSVNIQLDITTEDFRLLEQILEEKQISLNEFVEEFITKQIKVQEHDNIKQALIKEILLDKELSKEYINLLYKKGGLIFMDHNSKSLIYRDSDDDLLKYLKTEGLGEIIDTILFINKNRKNLIKN